VPAASIGAALPPKPPITIKPGAPPAPGFFFTEAMARSTEGAGTVSNVTGPAIVRADISTSGKAANGR